MRSNKKRKEGKPSHIVSAWSQEGGFSLGQKDSGGKSNEITGIPKLLKKDLDPRTDCYNRCYGDTKRDCRNEP